MDKDIEILLNTLNKINKCNDCPYIGHYKDELFARNPHCCCELRYKLFKDDYKVDKNSIDENCILKKLLNYPKELEKEKNRKRYRKYYQNHKEQEIKRSKKNYRKNKEYFKKYRHEYYLKTKK